MKKVLLAMIAIVAIGGCDDKEIDATLNFRLVYDGEPLVMTEDYRYPSGELIRFNRVSFFISDVMIGDGEDEVLALEAAMINPTRSHLDVMSAEQGLDVDLGSICVESLQKLSFNIGLTESQNATVPADYPSGDELARPGEYWLAWDSYIFLKLEGFIDLDGDENPETAFALHAGSDDVMRRVSFDNPKGGDKASFIIDIERSFGSGDELYDMVEHNQIHSLSQLPQAVLLADNFSNTINID